MLFPDKGDGSDPRACPLCNDGKLALRGGRFGAFIACSNYPECKYTRKFGQPGGAENGEGEGPEIMGQHPETGLDIVRKSRSEERRVGKEWVSTCRTGGWRSN